MAKTRHISYLAEDVDAMAKFFVEQLTLKELEELRLSAQRGRPFGSESWRKGIAAYLGSESTLRTRGRPRKEK